MPSNSATIQHSYGTGIDVLSETDSAGTVQKDYIYFGGKRTAYVYNSAVYFYFSDHLGSSKRVDSLLNVK